MLPCAKGAAAAGGTGTGAERVRI